jgi:hypothetical protein
VRAGAADLGLASATAHDLRDQFMLDDDFVAALPRGHRLSTASSLTFDALAAPPFITSGADCAPMIRSFFAAAGRAPRVAFTVRDKANIV